MEDKREALRAKAADSDNQAKFKEMMAKKKKKK
jgi:hypothetical protein